MTGKILKSLYKKYKRKFNGMNIRKKGLVSLRGSGRDDISMQKIKTIKVYIHFGPYQTLISYDVKGLEKICAFNDE